MAVAYLAVSVGILLKGPVALILPGMVGAVVLVLEAVDKARRGCLDWQTVGVRRLGLHWGLPLVVIVSIPWFVWADIHSGGKVFQTLLWHHNLERALGQGGLRAHPFWFYFPRLATDFLPWTPLLIIALWTFIRSPSHNHDPEARFGLIWLITMFTVLSCAGFKRADYLLPAFPGAALFLGYRLECWYQQTGRVSRVAWVFFLTIIGCAAAWPFYVSRLLPGEEMEREDRRFAAEIRKWAPAPQLVLFFRAEAHALAFHLGAPLDTFLEWENLNVWAGRPGCYYIVMPPECANAWRYHLTAGQLQEVLRNTELSGAQHHEHPLVLMRTRPNNES
jgi:4-amino-4-deoxy-L-arabinose transferase-like glycosyltransferase